MSNELPLAHTGDSSRAIRGRLGSGGKLIRVRTGDGSIRLRPY
jgi:hypothetical protein